MSHGEGSTLWLEGTKETRRERVERMATQKERRRRRRCPSCGGEKMTRGREVEGVLVKLASPAEDSEEVAVPAYSDVCGECGLVTLFVRIGED
jgi:hypothetical protein